jgi:hypothetical protein
MQALCVMMIVSCFNVHNCVITDLCFLHGHENLLPLLTFQELQPWVVLLNTEEMSAHLDSNHVILEVFHGPAFSPKRRTFGNCTGFHIVPFHGKYNCHYPARLHSKSQTPKTLCAFSSNCILTSSMGCSRKTAIRATISWTNSGVFFCPRNGAGVAYGLSVSACIISSGI